jgi:hypothetical protein
MHSDAAVRQLLANRTLARVDARFFGNLSPIKACNALTLTWLSAIVNFP